MRCVPRKSLSTSDAVVPAQASEPQNGAKILHTDNMFHEHSVRIETHLKSAPALNVLVLHFRSAKLAAKQLEARYGRVRAGSTNLGDPSRVYVRKAQYDWRYVLHLPSHLKQSSLMGC